MPTIKLPLYFPADSQKGACDAAKYSGMQSTLLIGCIELAVISEGKGDPAYDLALDISEGFTNLKQATKAINKVAMEVIEMFDIRNFTDWLNVRPLIEQLYSSVALLNNTEYVNIHGRWYVRTWESYKYKAPKNDFGVLLHMDDTNGNVGIGIAVDGLAFKLTKSGGVLYRNTSKKRREKSASLEVYRNQGYWQKMMEIYSGIDLYKLCDRQRLVNLCAIEVMETIHNVLVMEHATAEQIRFDKGHGLADVVVALELAATQTRHQTGAKQISVNRTTTYGLGAQANGSNKGPEQAAKLTAFYRPELIRSKTSKPKTTAKKTVKTSKKQ